MTKPEAVAIVRSEVHEWFAKEGRPDNPSFADFKSWVLIRHPTLFDFRSTMGAHEDLEAVWAKELGQSWKY